jgi:hypothetical protein
LRAARKEVGAFDPLFGVAELVQRGDVIVQAGDGFAVRSPLRKMSTYKTLS